MILSPAWFAEHFGTFAFIFIVVIVALYTFQKRSVKEKKEVNRVEKSISENGVIRHHAKEIIKNYGSGSFLNKTPAEIEVIVNEYNDLFKMRFDSSMVTTVVTDIINELNDLKK